MTDPRQDEPEAPPPATWAGRERSPSEEPPPPEGEHDEGLTPGAEGAEEEELEDELDADELDEEELAEELDQGDGPDPAPGPATMETDTPALADREAAREAALAGLRARTAQHAAKQPAAGAPAAPAAPPAAAEPKAPAEPPPAAAQAEAPAGDGPPSPGPDQEEGAPERGLWPRFLAGSLLIIVAMTTATAVSLLVYLKGIARGLGGLPSVQSQLEDVEPGNPQTILILGSDKRPIDGGASGRSDTTILLRVASDQISVMSIPRDLKVNIPGHGIDRFNAAYSYGGPKLALEVVKQQTGLDNINHVVNVDFNGFADAVNAIGCVYVDVDHHYYHSNVGLAASEQYAEIDVPAGYQRMCGFNALQYVRYRHEDNDLVRAARQQEFLREARQELPAEEILEERNELIDILKKHVTSDIEDETDLVSLGRLFIGAGDASVVQIDFPANLGASYVTASEPAIQEAVKRFEGESEPPPEPQPAEDDSNEKPPKNQDAKPPAPSPPPLVDSSSTGVSGEQFAAKLAGVQTKSGKPMLDFPIYYPTKLAPSSTLTDDSRAFPIDGPGDQEYRGYKLVAALTTEGYTAYYGVSGTDWKDPPILENPSETRTIDGREYKLSWDGGRLRFIGWKTERGSYWVDNTLLSVLTPGQMFGIAESTRNYTG